MRWLIFHFLFCSLLLTDSYLHERKKIKKIFKRTPSPTWIKKIRPRLKRKRFKVTKKDRELLYSLATGKKRALKNLNIYQTIQKSQMLHLLTPSGLHLSSLLLFLFLVLRSRKQKIFSMFVISPLLFFITDFQAAKRVFVLKLCTLYGLPIKPAFYLVFAGAFLIKPGLSVLLSFLFIGVLILNPFKTISSQLFFMNIAQIIVGVYFNQAYYLFSCFINPLGSLYIALIFPWLMLTILLPSIYLWSTKYLLSFFYFIIEFIEFSPSL